MKSRIIIILLVLLIFSQKGSSEVIKRKDPLLAGVLSWYMAGLGQIYAGEYVKGTVFWVIDYTLYISAILTVADINFSANKDIGFQINIKPKEYISAKQKTIAISLSVGYVVFHIYNIIDAIKTVRKNNLKIQKIRREHSFFLDFESDGNNNYFSLNYKI